VDDSGDRRFAGAGDRESAPARGRRLQPARADRDRLDDLSWRSRRISRGVSEVRSWTIRSKKRDRGFTSRSDVSKQRAFRGRDRHLPSGSGVSFSEGCVAQ